MGSDVKSHVRDHDVPPGQVHPWGYPDGSNHDYRYQIIAQLAGNFYSYKWETFWSIFITISFENTNDSKYQKSLNLKMGSRIKVY